MLKLNHIFLNLETSLRDVSWTYIQLIKFLFTLSEQTGRRRKGGQGTATKWLATLSSNPSGAQQFSNTVYNPSCRASVLLNVILQYLWLASFHQPFSEASLQKLLWHTEALFRFFALDHTVSLFLASGSVKPYCSGSPTQRTSYWKSLVILAILHNAFFVSCFCGNA